MGEKLNIRFTFYPVDNLPPQIVEVEAPLKEWERAQRLDYEARMDYVFRLCNFDTQRDSVAKVDVKIISQ